MSSLRSRNLFASSSIRDLTDSKTSSPDDDCETIGIHDYSPKNVSLKLNRRTLPFYLVEIQYRKRPSIKLRQYQTLLTKLPDPDGVPRWQLWCLHCRDNDNILDRDTKLRMTILDRSVMSLVDVWDERSNDCQRFSLVDPRACIADFWNYVSASLSRDFSFFSCPIASVHLIFRWENHATASRDGEQLAQLLENLPIYVRDVTIDFWSYLDDKQPRTAIWDCLAQTQLNQKNSWLARLEQHQPQHIDEGIRRNLVLVKRQASPVLGQLNLVTSGCYIWKVLGNICLGWGIICALRLISGTGHKNI